MQEDSKQALISRDEQVASLVFKFSQQVDHQRVEQLNITHDGHQDKEDYESQISGSNLLRNHRIPVVTNEFNEKA